MKNLANKNIQEMCPYKKPPDDRLKFDGMLLDFNERTIPPTENLMRDLLSLINERKLNIYPDDDIQVRQMLADYLGVDVGEVMLTNGSDQGIDTVFRTFTAKADKVIIPTPSYSMFYQFAEIMENFVVNSNYKEDLSFPLEEVLNTIDEKSSLVIICSPNNPTGTLVKITDIEKILQKALDNDAMVFVDEAYFEFCNVTALSLIKKYSNLIVSRTFSKAFGLAGLRIGYLVSSKLNISEMEKVRNPYDINLIAYYGIIVALKNLDETRKYISEIMNEAKPLVEKFFKENNIQFWNSVANFILFKPSDAKCVFDKLRDGGLLVRPRNGVNIEGTIRLTIGTVAQMEKFIQIYKKLFINK